MVKIYNPNVVGKHILIDVKNIENDRLKTVEIIKPFMDKVVEEFNLMSLVSAHINLKKIISLMVLQWFIYYLKVIYLFILL
jgi:hypothetical protein